jgi:hypothetical protein
MSLMAPLDSLQKFNFDSQIGFDLVGQPSRGSFDMRVDYSQNNPLGFSQSDTTIIHLAAQKGHQNIVRILSEFGVDLAAKDSSGQTSLHLAAAHGMRIVSLISHPRSSVLCSRILSSHVLFHLLLGSLEIPYDRSATL